MRDRKVGKLFERFRQDGDARALADVFDAVAPELLRIATNLLRDPAEADDALQATFLTAIEKRDDFDASRSLVPWLLGILVNHARDMRRKRIHSTAVSADSATTPDASRDAEDAELSTEVDAALRGLPPRYRSVLHAYLAEGQAPADIALATGRAPGTVRMQIHRGLALLRKALPAGLGLGAAFTTSGRGLAAVKAEVLRHAADVVPVSAAGGAAASAFSIQALIGGIAVSKTSVAAAAVLVTALAVMWMRSTDPALDGGLSAEPEGEVVVAEVQPDEAQLVRVEAPAADVPRAPAVPTESATTAVEASAFVDDRTGVTGRVVDADGPVAGVSVALFNGSVSQFLDNRAEHNAFEAGIFAGAARTGADGRFVVRGVRADGFHALGVDLGGERSTVRAIDRSLEVAKTLDVGDIELHPRARIVGVVVDEEGRGVAGARVRAGRVMKQLIQAGAADIRAGSRMCFEEGPGALIFDLPPWIAAALDQILPSATTDESGAFVLDADAGPVTLIADRSGYVTATVPVEAADGTAERKSVPLVLSRGRTLEGFVVDESGSPVPGASVLGVPVRGGGVTTEETQTDEHGAFRISGVRTTGIAMVAARRGAPDSWTLVRASADKDTILTLPVHWTVHVAIERQDGGELEEVDVSVIVDSQLRSRLPAVARSNVANVTRVAAGRFDVAGIAARRVRFVTSGPGLATTEHAVTLERNGEVIELSIESPRYVDVVVEEKLSQSPVGRAQILAAEGGWPGSVVGRATTAADGTARLALPAGIDTLHVRGAHPTYGSQRLQLSADEDVARIELAPAGSLDVRIRNGGAAPERSLLVILWSADDDEPDWSHFRMGTTDASGDGHIAVVPAGGWRYGVMPRFSARNIVELLGLPNKPLLEGEVTVVSGERTTLDLDLDQAKYSLSAAGGTRLSITVNLDGAPAPDLQVMVHNYTDQSAKTFTLDTQGRLDAELAPGQHFMSIGEANGNQLFSENFKLREGEHKRLDYGWVTIPCEVRVTDEDGEAVAGARVRLARHSEGTYHMPSGTSGADGVARFRVLDSGEYRLSAQHEEQGIANDDVVVSSGEVLRHSVQLFRGVPCAGEVRVEGGPSFEWAQISFRSEDGKLSRSSTTEVTDGLGAFSVAGMSPGTYQVWLFTQDFQPPPIEVTLPAGGDAQMLLSF